MIRFTLASLITLYSLNVQGQITSKVDYDAFEKLVAEVKPHRAKHLITLDEFVQMCAEKKVIILDARSPEMYRMKHVKGAINLTFADFTQERLDQLIPSRETKILIYCNNNFDDDAAYFPTKSAKPVKSKESSDSNAQELTLALNIPTYINLYGYGYRNVYELAELISVFDERILFEGEAVPFQR